MDLKNPLYSNQGIHVISTIFTIENGIVKILLARRKKEPYKGEWILVGGACYNNEDIDDAIKREILEKTGIYDISLEQFKAFGKPYRSPQQRMIAIGYIGVVSYNDEIIHKESRNISDIDWFPINNIPKLGFDHEEILEEGLEVLKSKIQKTDILKVLFKRDFTLPELQRVYEIILNKKFDRRNFRKRFLNLGLIGDTNRVFINKVGKPARLYKFKKNIRIKDVF
jgi:8-oxo-dGTP diphosphatase